MKKPGRSKHETQPWPSDWRREARRLLLAWFRRNARDLAWRKTRDPYAIWVSEIMLQQTQVATVERYFPRFLAAFPNIAALAAASEQQVLRQWEGLGYYRRARQMHAAARKISDEHAGVFPRELEHVRQLPGIGRYTAGAIMSIAFNSRQPILEANTIRLFARLLAYRGNTASSVGQTVLWEAAESLLGKSGHGELNQALMELGSLVCTPRNPRCDACPLESLCPTRQAGLQNEIPAPRRQPIMEDVHEAAVIVFNRSGQILLRKCAEGERWAGLWDFPRFKRASDSASPRRIFSPKKKPISRTKIKRKANAERNLLDQRHIDQTTSNLLAAGVKQLTGVSISSPQSFTSLRHGVTRFRITLDCFIAKCAKQLPRAVGKSNGLRWVRPVDLHEYPLSVTGRKLAKLLTDAPPSKPSSRRR